MQLETPALLTDPLVASQAFSSEYSGIEITPIGEHSLAIELQSIVMDQLFLTKVYTESGFHLARGGPHAGYTFAVIEEGSVVVESRTTHTQFAESFIIDPSVRGTKANPGARWIAMHFSEGAIVRALERISHTVWTTAPSFTSSMDAKMSAVFHHLYLAIQEGARNGFLAEHPSAREGFQEALFRLAHASLRTELEPAATSQRQVLRAMDYMIENARRSITVAEVAREAGLSLRSLQMAFAEQLMLSPSAFLRQQRLSLARKDLVSGAVTSVAEASAKWGFESRSSFTRAYIEQFGEKPSRDLRSKTP